MAPSSDSRLYRLRRILQLPFETPSPCDRCHSRGKTCTFIADFSIMACAECTRQGRPCVTSSLDRLDRVADELAHKITADEKAVDTMMDEIGVLLRRVDEIRRRISRNKVVQTQNNRRTEEQVRHLVETLSPEEENAGFSEAVILGTGLEAVDASDPFDWSWEVPDSQTPVAS